MINIKSVFNTITEKKRDRFVLLNKYNEINQYQGDSNCLVKTSHMCNASAIVPNPISESITSSPFCVNEDDVNSPSHEDCNFLCDMIYENMDDNNIINNTLFRSDLQKSFTESDGRLSGFLISDKREYDSNNRTMVDATRVKNKPTQRTNKRGFSNKTRKGTTIRTNGGVIESSNESTNVNTRSYSMLYQMCVENVNNLNTYTLAKYVTDTITDSIIDSIATMVTYFIGFDCYLSICHIMS
jgi:hypothetical protein